MNRKNEGGQRLINSYHLSPQQLAEIHRKYGRPGELSPGQPAKRKRNRLDAALAALDRKDNTAITPFDEENEFEPDIT
ncbi:MAG: hypothetical protein K6U74_12155 [Firmicutes bacterium]|nr:hypothetical protein [Bacillota bacterium]